MGKPRGDNGQTVFVVMNPFSYRKSYTGPMFSTLDRSVSSITVKATPLPSGHNFLDVKSIKRARKKNTFPDSVERRISTASGSGRGFLHEPRSLPLAVLIREDRISS